jgi:hypothetical protein
MKILIAFNGGNWTLGCEGLGSYFSHDNSVAVGLVNAFVVGHFTRPHAQEMQQNGALWPQL